MRQPKADSKTNALRKSECPNYDKLRQLFASNAATGAYQISSSTPTPDSDEKRALEEEIANEARRTQLGTDDCYNPDMEGITQDDPLATEQTQHADKHPIEKPTGKGKKVAKKADKASDMTIALQEYTTLARERFNKKMGRSMGISDHVAQSATSGDPCSLGRASDVLNQYNDLDYDTYINISENGLSNDPFWTFDFDDAYFDSDDDDMENSGCGDDMDVSDCDHDMDRHYDKRPMHTSILSGKDYMAKVRDGNPTNCHDMFHMTLDLFYHLVDELKQHGHKFRRVLRAVHTYGQHLIKPNPNAVSLPEHMQSNNKYYPWFKRSVGAIDGTHISTRPPSQKTQPHRSYKSLITTNVMCACDHDMKFTYVHSGYEGSATT
uniref:DUF8040 domain-containing protein n=1 Tax=Quercus lobata TaxID=97700 RepID=A0A7N2KQ02_QUELO